MAELGRTVPFPDVDKLEWHWLYAERAWTPTIAQWIKDAYHYGEWHCIGEERPISPEEMYRRGWRWLAAAIPPKILDDDEPRKIPDFGMKTEIAFEDTDYPLELTCKYAAPGLTFTDLILAFNAAEADWSAEDNLSGNPSKWKNHRGVHAVLVKILDAIYINNPVERIKSDI